MLKVVTFVGTRPELIKLSRVISALDVFCEHTLVHTGQNFDYELNELLFEQLNIRQPDIQLNVAGASSAQTVAKTISAADEVLRQVKPDAVLVLGDTNSCFAAFPAKRLKIPIFHMEAGNRCFDQRVPEEINRKIIDHISDVNLPYSQIARDYLLREGCQPDLTIVTGSPMKEVLSFYKPKIANSKILENLSLSDGKFYLVSFHREENLIDGGEKQLNKIVQFLSKLDHGPVVVSTHPRTRNALKSLGVQNEKNVRYVEPFGFIDYVKLQGSAKCVLSDSGTLSEESNILGFDAINLRECHERPEATEEGGVMFTGTSIRRIDGCLKILDKATGKLQSPRKLVQDYDVNDVSNKIVKIIMSYTDYVHSVVWKRP